jgi:SAM-dependent methyltransferase
MHDVSSPVDGTHGYEGYVGWKSWSKPFEFSTEDAEYFAGETRDIAISGSDLLEIGFGNGNFLAWARSRGARIAGIEIIPELIAAAKTEGVPLLPAEIETIAADHAGRFDSIIAIDVFEHFPLDMVARRIAACLEMLKPGGKLLLRFPNAQSPFGLPQQFGDPTHKSALSRGVIEQLTMNLDYRVVRYSGPYRIVGRFPKSLARRLRYLARNIIEGTLNAIYCQSIPLEPNAVIVLQKGTTGL